MYNYSTPFIAEPRSRESIRKDTYEIRRQLDLLHEPCFPIMDFIEKFMPLIDPEFSLDIVTDEEMGAVLAEAIPEEHTIRVKESVYKGACLNHYWHRMTMAHELGHYIYHKPGQVRLARLMPGIRIPYSCNPEVQADIFAAELLMPVNLVKTWDQYRIAKSCNVSFRAAELQYRQLTSIKRSKKKKPDRIKQSGGH